VFDSGAVRGKFSLSFRKDCLEKRSAKRFLGSTMY
jgi:hypothetical protein